MTKTTKQSIGWIVFGSMLSMSLVGCLKTVEPSPTATETSTSDRTSEDRKTCVADYNSDLDYFPDKATIEYAKGFEVDYHKNYKVVTVRDPWNLEKEPFQYVLVQCGTPVPEEFKNSEIIEIPVRSVAALSTTYLSHLDALNLVDRLTGVQDAKTVSTPSIRQRIDSGDIIEVAYNRTIDIEGILALNPDLIVTFGVEATDSESYAKLLEAGFDVAVNSEYLENAPLGRAEWLKFTALFFNREADAERIFSDIARDYNRIAELTKTVEDRPTVFTEFNYQGTWFVPGGESYVAKFLEDAGADYLWKDTDSTASLPLDFEVVYDVAADADFWLNVDRNWDTKEDAIADDPRYRNFEAWQTGQIYNYTARVNEYGGNDYWESGVLNPNVILADLVTIFHPELLPNTEKVYYEKIDGDS
ncbi:ABC transporter substrate-binding protein [Leptolyngbya valderiana BDU 20041]|nr:ABC transporter substrate-binding protein [Leptolyngbya valderiana BDU 20041]